MPAVITHYVDVDCGNGRLASQPGVQQAMSGASQVFGLPAIGVGPLPLRLVVRLAIFPCAQLQTEMTTGCTRDELAQSCDLCTKHLVCDPGVKAIVSSADGE